MSAHFLGNRRRGILAMAATIAGIGLAALPLAPVSAAPAPTPSAAVAPHITGRIWHDVDRDGVIDSTEQGIGGINVVLAQFVEGTPALHLRNARTDTTGRFAFPDVTPFDRAGTAAVYVALPEGWVWASTQQVTPEDPATLPPSVVKALGTNRDVMSRIVNPTTTDDDAMIAGLGKPGTNSPGSLPTTGADVGILAAGGGVLLAGGIALVFAARRRRAS